MLEIATAFYFKLFHTQSYINVKYKHNDNMPAFKPIFNIIFQYSDDDDALDLFFKSVWNSYQHNQKREKNEPYIIVNPINRRSEIGKKLHADAVDVEFVEL